MLQLLRSLRRPGRYTRPGLFRRWWHIRQHHTVCGTVVDAARRIGNNRLDFYFRPGWVCLDCHLSWP